MGGLTCPLTHLDYARPAEVQAPDDCGGEHCQAAQRAAADIEGHSEAAENAGP